MLGRDSGTAASNFMDPVTTAARNDAARIPVLMMLISPHSLAR